MTIQEMLDNARQMQQAMTQGALVREVLQNHGDDIVDMQRTQLLMGKGSDGQDLHPFYSEDLKPKGYFRSRRSAENYRAWKQDLSYPKNVKRNPDAPNLYITGVFHNDLNVRFDADSVAIVPDTAYAANIMAKYGFGIFGLCSSSWSVIWGERGAKDELITKMKTMLWS